MNGIKKQDTKDLGSLFGSFTEDQIDLIKKTVCKNSTDNELKLFLYTCKNAGLDPLLKQIYAIKRGNAMTIQTSIDGLRSIAERTGRYAPGEEAKYTYDSSNEIVSATVYVKKMTMDGTWHQVASTAFFEEYAQRYNGKLSQFWGKFPHVMIQKCAEAHALRKAFPFELASLYTTVEMSNGLNKSMDQEEMLKEEMLNDDLIGITPQDDVEIIIPEGADQIEVNAYIEYLCDHFCKSIPVMKSRINEKPEKFWEAFHKWIVKKEEEVIKVESSEDTTIDLKLNPGAGTAMIPESLIVRDN